MSMRYLGETIDIHTGGLDHIPVHHENEIAQSESATGHPFVRYFVHNAFLTGMAGAKISKSAGKFPVLDDLVDDDINPPAFRMLCLSAKYRSELAFNIREIEAMELNLNYLDEFCFKAHQMGAMGVTDSAWVTNYLERFHEELNNDLNTPSALAIALEMVNEANRRNDLMALNTLLRLDDVLGLGLSARLKESLTEERSLGLVELESLQVERERARAVRDYNRADELRALIHRKAHELGYELRDTPSGKSIFMPKRGRT
jgi:cysteinyl-tRNA synthetase